MSKVKKNRDRLYILTAHMGIPPNLSKMRGMVTQTPVFARHLTLYFLSACFYIVSVCWTRICRTTFYIWRPSPSNKQSKKWPPKPHLFIFLLNIIARFLLSAWFGVIKINVCLKFFDPNDFKFKMVTTNTQIKAIFMHVNYNIINNICSMGI